MSISDIIKYVQVTLVVTWILFIPVLLIRYRLTKGRLKNDSWKHEMASILFIFYVISLYEITAFRFGGIGWDFERMIERRTRVNGEPLRLVWDWTVKGVWWHLFYNVIGNCVWFIPMGFMMPAIYKNLRSNPFFVVFFGTTVSSSIEVLQYILCTGVTDIDDVIFNTLGTAIGCFLWYLFDNIRKKGKNRW